ncbi:MULTISPECIES: class I adenylate-forming enzyme family protein [unclassified Bradyrhizobium]|uniref:class I adenylate-forming enzyme family protein n=1 Tax=unclassified Bradyrhizobium TaxID=2631580 RepID=UPI0029163807|nr:MULTISPECIES: class I adenylate-forming enzyme family protein [unclassified Bradyrhizobium]
MVVMIEGNSTHTPWTYRNATLSDRLIEMSTIKEVLLAREADCELPALSWYQDGVCGERWSYSQLTQKVANLAAELTSHEGITKGARIVVLSRNCPEVYLLYLAILSIGAIAVPVNNEESPRALEFICRRVEPSLIVVGRDVARNLLVGIDAPICSADVLAARQKAQLRVWPDVSPDDIGVILFTSGTTSVPKGVCLSQYNLLVNAEALRRSHELDRNRSHLCVLPLFHANAFGFSMIASIYSGCHVVLYEGMFGRDLWAILRAERVNVFSTVPDILRLLASQSHTKEKLPDLRFVTCAAAPLANSVADAFENHTGIAIHQGYGLSECTNFAATMPCNISNEARRKLMGTWEVPSVGPAIFGTEIRIARPGGAPASPEEKGEVLISGHNVMSGYWRAKDETDMTFRDGWLHTGDVGFFVELDGEAYFFIAGRLKELIIRHGDNIAPHAVEGELAGLELLGRFAVCGFANDAAGEEIGIYIHAPFTVQARRSAVDIVSRCASRYRPRVVLFGDRPIPTTVTGKVRRNVLAKHFDRFRTSVFGSRPWIAGIDR